MKSVHVLCRIDPPHHCVWIDLLRERHLHQNAMDFRIGVERVDTAEKVGLSRISGKTHVEAVHASLFCRL